MQRIHTDKDDGYDDYDDDGGDGGDTDDKAGGYSSSMMVSRRASIWACRSGG